MLKKFIQSLKQRYANYLIRKKSNQIIKNLKLLYSVYFDYRSKSSFNKKYIDILINNFYCDSFFLRDDASSHIETMYHITFNQRENATKHLYDVIDIHLIDQFIITKTIKGGKHNRTYDLITCIDPQANQHFKTYFNLKIIS